MVDWHHARLNFALMAAAELVKPRPDRRGKKPGA